MEKRITKSNSIVNASYRLSLNELRIVLYGLSNINPRAEEFPLEHKINVREIAEFYNIGDKDRGSFYDDIKNALVTKFWEREFSYFDEELGKTIKRRWLIEVQYGGKDGVLSYSYNPKLSDQLQQLSQKFTSYFLENIANMKSSYAVRIYEISIMYVNASKQNKVVFTKTIDELKLCLGICGKYKHFFNMKRNVLEIAKRDINKHSDIKISYEVKKLGRSPYEIEFTVFRKKTKEDALLVKPDEEPSLKPRHLTPAIFDKAKKIVSKAGNQWDLYAIEQQFFEYIERRGPPESLEKAFLGFVRKKVESPP